METFGSIVDKLCIIERRIKELKSKGKPYYFLYEQQGWLIKGLGDYIAESFMGERPFTFKKNKLYDEGVNVEEDQSLLEYIFKLKEYNDKLWDLEDIRRNKGIPDIERLKVCDQVSEYNKLRNDSIDMIDSAVLKAAKSSHLEKENEGDI